MSLINQMLRDLEQRRKREASTRAEVTAVTIAGKRRWPWFAGGLVLAALGGAVLVSMFSAPPKSADPQPVAVHQEKVAAPRAAVPQQNDAQGDNALLSLQASESDRELRLVLELRHAVDWQIVRSDPRSVTVAVPLAIHTTLDSGSLKWLDHWRQVEGDDGNTLIFTATTDMTWNVFHLAGDSQHGWRMVIQGLVVENVTPASEPEETIEPPQAVTEPLVPVPLPAEEQPTGTLKKEVAPRDQLWSAAQQARQKGDFSEATRLLIELVALAPDDREGRFELIKVLLQQRTMEHALQVAEQGRQRQPDEPLWLILKARLLAETDQLAEALFTLDVEPVPAVNQSPEFYALKAALLQQATRYEDALLIYQQLCGVFPRQAQWWFGRAVTANQLGDQRQARDSFKQALALPGLDAQLQHYATQQLQRLGGGN
nr:tetratricopeptide repeat protein [uncultured Desulfuromonas sp.]